MKIPDGTSESAFKAALQEFSNVVGRDNVYTKEEDVALYRDAYSPFADQAGKVHEAGAAVAPATVEQVQAIMRIANKYKVPISPVSTGRNLGYGGSAPVLSGAVVLDLKRMDKIIEVNERDGYMIVEPGVSFIDAHKHLMSIGSKLRVSSPEPGWGSPVGNGLERGVGSATMDNFSLLKGFEVVLPSGELLRTGCGAVPNSKLWGLNEYGFGPHITGMFSQSNFGVVTKGIFWLTPQWEATQGISIESYRSEDLESYIETLYPLRNSGMIVGFLAGSPIRESMSRNDGRRPFGVPAVTELLMTADGGSFAQWDELAAATKIPAAQAAVQFRGHPNVIAAQVALVKDICKDLPGTLKLSPVMDAGIGYEPNIDFDILGNQGYSRGHYYFSPIFRVDMEEIYAVNDVIRRTCIDHGDPDMAGYFGWNGAFTGLGAGKHGLILMDILVHDDPALNNKRAELFGKLVKACGARGWPEYRAAIYFMDTVMDQFSFADHSLRRFHETVKDALDPNGILAPGKSGIWPKRLRRA